jgi:adenylosuccinate lyase
MERTLDDSAIRRLVIPQTFLAIDALLTLYLNLVPGLMVHPAMVAKHVAAELPFMATENLLMAAVQLGGDRQDLHERIRTHSLAAAARLKEGESENDLIERLRADAAFPRVDFEKVLEPSQFIGRAMEQVEALLASEVEPVRRRYPAQRDQRGEIDV